MSAPAIERWRAEETAVEARALIHEAEAIRERLTTVRSLPEALRLADLMVRRAAAAAAEWLELNEVD